MKSNRLVSIILVLFLCLLLVACGGNDETSGKADDGQVTLQYWVGWSPGEANAKESRELIEEYEKENPNIKIDIQELNYEMIHDKLVAGISAGEVPDISWGLGEWVAEFNSMDAFMDLTEYVNNWDDKKNIQERALEAVTINNKIVGLPFQTGARGLLVHDDILKKAGIETVPKTWDELIKVGKEYNKKTNNYLFGFTGTSVRAPQEMIGYFAQNGVEIATEMSDGKFKNTWKEDTKQLEAVANVFDFYKDLIDSKVVDPNSKTWDWESADTNFSTGNIAMEVSGNWMSEREVSNPDTMKDVSIFPTPYGEKPATFLEVKPLFIFKDSKHKEEAWKFAQFIMSKEFQEKVQPSNTPRTDVMEEGKWGKDFQKLVETGVSFPPVSLGNITTNMEDALAKVLQNNEDSLEVAKWLSDEINKSLETSGELSNN